MSAIGVATVERDEEEEEDPLYDYQSMRSEGSFSVIDNGNMKTR